MKGMYMLTMKGWLTLRRMFFSFWTCWTCLSLMTSAMARIFRAQYSRVLFSRHSTTRPNVPVPNQQFIFIHNYSNYSNYSFAARGPLPGPQHTTYVRPATGSLRPAGHTLPIPDLECFKVSFTFNWVKNVLKM